VQARSERSSADAISLEVYIKKAFEGFFVDFGGLSVYINRVSGVVFGTFII
jgi:hypothetical protein